MQIFHDNEYVFYSIYVRIMKRKLKQFTEYSLQVFVSHMSFDCFTGICDLQATWPCALENDTSQVLQQVD